MSEAFICDAVHTPIGRYRGALASVRDDDLAALPQQALIPRNPRMAWRLIENLTNDSASRATIVMERV